MLKNIKIKKYLIISFISLVSLSAITLTSYYLISQKNSSPKYKDEELKINNFDYFDEKKFTNKTQILKIDFRFPSKNRNGIIKNQNDLNNWKKEVNELVLEKVKKSNLTKASLIEELDKQRKALNDFFDNFKKVFNANFFENFDLVFYETLSSNHSYSSIVDSIQLINNELIINSIDRWIIWGRENWKINLAYYPPQLYLAVVPKMPINTKIKINKISTWEQYFDYRKEMPYKSFTNLKNKS
ncbi:hypothetical protein ACW95P_02320 [Candidatus Mycoplasma pogonae]